MVIENGRHTFSMTNFQKLRIRHTPYFLCMNIFVHTCVCGCVCVITEQLMLLFEKLTFNEIANTMSFD